MAGGVGAFHGEMSPGESGFHVSVIQNQIGQRGL